MIILSPGPANISQRVRQALTLPDICHRDVEFSELLGEVRSLLLEALGLRRGGFEAVVFGGSGTLAIESLLTCFSGWDRTLLIVSNGVYGERASDISGLYGVKARKVRFDWGQYPDLALLEDELRDPEVGGVYIVHHETTTGLLNPLQEVCGLAQRYDKLALADTVSSIAGEEIDFGWGLDAAVGSANKCIRGVPGVSFAILSSRLLDTARRRVRASYYSDLLTHLDREAGNETPFTPPVHALFAFREALRETLEEGVSARIAHYRRVSGTLRKGLKALGLKLLLDEELYGNTMTSIRLPSGVSFQDLHDRMKQKGFVIYNAQGPLRGRLFMIGVVGSISEQDIKDFLMALKETMGVLS